MILHRKKSPFLVYFYTVGLKLTKFAIIFLKLLKINEFSFEKTSFQMKKKFMILV